MTTHSDKTFYTSRWCYDHKHDVVKFCKVSWTSTSSEYCSSSFRSVITHSNRSLTGKFLSWSKVISWCFFVGLCSYSVDKHRNVFFLSQSVYGWRSAAHKTEQPTFSLLGNVLYKCIKSHSNTFLIVCVSVCCKLCYERAVMLFSFIRCKEDHQTAKLSAEEMDAIAEIEDSMKDRADAFFEMEAFLPKKNGFDSFMIHRVCWVFSNDKREFHSRVPVF